MLASPGFNSSGGMADQGAGQRSSLLLTVIAHLPALFHRSTSSPVAEPETDLSLRGRQPAIIMRS